jgi:glycosyltransferase involved in cell wall biosynthesis
MKICLVTAFPPSREALNEYGFHVASELRRTPGVSLTILGDDDFPVGEAELEGFNVERCWAFNKLDNASRLLRTIRRIKPDLVWFNLGFASFGGKPVPAFAGIAIPAMTRLAGFYTHVTLHQLMETVDLKDAGVRFPWMYRAGGFVATQILLLANSVSVMLPAYREILQRKYRRGAVYVRRHGIFGARPEYPDFSRRGNPQHRILAFGKWGTYKRLEPMIDAFHIVVRQFPNAELVIAGTDHPKTPGYLKSIAQQCSHEPKIKFLGYVAEEDVPALFQSATVTAMPYSSSGGSSGIAHLACAYGLPIIASDIPDFHQLADEEGLAIEYFTPGDIPALANRLLALLKNPEKQMEMALQNVSAALRMSMPEIMRQYLRTFTLRRHIDCLGSVSRLRRIPRWLPLRQTLVRMMGKRSFHQQLEYPVLEPAFEDAMASLNGNGQLSGGVLTTHVSVDSDGVAFGSGSSRGILDAAIPDAATAQHSDGNAEGADGQELTDSLPRTHSSGHH